MQFLRAKGKSIINQKGKPVYLKGVGLGNWMVPEGYMWLLGPYGDRPSKIDQLIREVLGNEEAELFWQEYRSRFISEKDIQQIAEMGFNCIRPALHYQFFVRSTLEDPLKEEAHSVEHDLSYFAQLRVLSRIHNHNIRGHELVHIEADRHYEICEEGFTLLDNLIHWCKKYHIYLILDLHAAPGGQTGKNIDDSPDDVPRLFMEDHYQQITLKFWEELARRYHNEPALAMYDLLNEPLPHGEFDHLQNRLMPFYRELVQRIRRFDQKHMITLEGANWSNDWSILDHHCDDNLVYQFHKYGGVPDRSSIQSFLEQQKRINLPVFVGETGENTNEWYQCNFQLLDDFRLHWAFWPWKKLAADNNPCSVKMPGDWNVMVDYSYSGTKPDQTRARRALQEFLENIRIENCDINKEVVNSVFRQVPIRLQAENFTHKGPRFSYPLNSMKSRYYRLDEGVRILSFQDDPSVYLNEKDWVEYQVDGHESREYDLHIKALRLSSVCRLMVLVDGQDETGELTVQSCSNDSDLIIDGIRIIGGSHKLRLKCLDGFIEIESLSLRDPFDTAGVEVLKEVSDNRSALPIPSRIGAGLYCLRGSDQKSSGVSNVFTNYYVRLEKFEWIKYQCFVKNKKEAGFHLKIRYAISQGPCKLEIILNNRTRFRLQLETTDWKEEVLGFIKGNAGKNNLKIKCVSGILDLNWLELAP